MAIATGAPGTISSGTINQLPDWYTNYAKTVSNLGQSLAESLPGYNGYVDATGNPVPMVAGLSGTQQKGIQNLNGGVGGWKGGLSAASGTAQAGVGAVQAGLGTVASASPMFGKAADAYGSSLNTINTGLGTVNNALTTAQQGQGQINAASGAINNMGGALDKASSLIDPAAAYTSKGTDGSEFSASKLAQYTNPYTTGVVNEIARLGNQNLMENVLPGVNSTFTGAGQFGSTRNGDFNARAIRDNQATISGQQAKVLSDAQSQALQLAQGSADRNLQAGAQTGQLSGIAQGVAAGYGNQAGTQIQQGQATLGAANTQLNAAGTQLNAAQGQQGAGAGFNSTGNNIVNQGQAQVAGGAQLGNLAQTQGGLTQAGQQMNVGDAAAQLAAGGLEQATAQKGLDAGRTDFLDRRDYPLQAIGALSQVLPGVSGKITPNTQTVQVNATAPTSPYQAIADVLGGLSIGSK